jgi:hypothetical protein
MSLLQGCASSYYLPAECPQIVSPPLNLMASPEKPEYQKKLAILLNSLENALKEPTN